MKSFFLLAVLLYIQSADLIKLKACEKEYLGKCSNVFINTWRSAGNGDNPREVYCRVYEKLGNCLGHVSRSCTGKIIDVQRLGIAEQMILQKKTGVCPGSKTINELKELTKANVPNWARKETGLSGVASAKPEKCDKKIANECADYIARNMIRDFKSKPCLGKEVTQKIFKCYESKMKECKSKLFRKFLDFLERYGKPLTEEEEKGNALPNCDSSNWE